MTAQPMTIGTLAQAAGVNVETVRYYQRKGLMPLPDKPQGSVRHYDDGDVARVDFIKSAQRLGFSLDEIAELLQLDDGAQCRIARGIAERKLAAVRTKLSDLRRIEATLADLVVRCRTARRAVQCPLIESLRKP